MPLTEVRRDYVLQVRKRLGGVHADTGTVVAIGQPRGEYPNGTPLGGVSLQQGALTITERFPPGVAMATSLATATSTLTQRYTQLQTRLKSAVDGVDDLLRSADATESLNEMTVERFRTYVPNVFQPTSTPPPPVLDKE